MTITTATTAIDNEFTIATTKIITSGMTTKTAGTGSGTKNVTAEKNTANTVA